MENKKKICELLLRLLQETRAGVDLLDLVYDENTKTVRMVFVSGYKKTVDVEADSSLAVIRDIIRNL